MRKHVRNKISLLSVMVIGLSLGACDHYSNDLAALKTTDSYQSASVQHVTDIAPAAGPGASSVIDPAPFSEHLAREYTRLALSEQEAYDYRAAKYYTAKAKSLRSGKMVAPAMMKADDIKDQGILSELQEARKQLVGAMHHYNIPENRGSLARAQSHFDCWVDQAAEGKEDSQCRSVFETSMAALQFPEGYVKSIPILFGGADGQMASVSYKGMKEVIGFWKQYGQSGLFDLTILAPASFSPETVDSQVASIRSILKYNGVFEPVEVQLGETVQEPAIQIRKKDSVSEELGSI
ncbi:MAG: hypothetical protein MRY79_04065 [Alphaproteobacteria bacterium]|nr:hypothetical protein [Alphaproteobacteria bacterium]